MEKKLLVEVLPNNSDFCQCHTAPNYDSFEKPNLKLGTRFASQSMTSGKVYSRSLHRKYLKLLPFFQENCQSTQ